MSLDHEPPLSEGDKVYIRDAAYAWLPAKIVQTQNDRVQVKIELPHNWSDSTTVAEEDGSSSSTQPMVKDEEDAEAPSSSSA